MLATGTLTSDLIVLVPVGSMIIANAMNACAQAMERFRADVLAHVGQIETGLSPAPILRRRSRPMFKAPSTPAFSRVLTC